MEKTLPISILIIVTILVSTLWTVPCTAASGQTFKFVLNWQEASGRGGADVEAVRLADRCREDYMMLVRAVYYSILSRIYSRLTRLLMPWPRGL